jgi:hypothetical protein
MNDTPLLRLAGRQHGLVAIGQLIRLGYSQHHIRWRIRVGILFRVYRGVYAVAGSADTFEFRVMAAVLAARAGALASHRCAAVLYGLRRIRCDRPAITVAGRKPPEINGIERHRRDTLTTVDRARIGVIPVTAPAWTLLDLAGGLDLADGAERGDSAARSTTYSFANWRPSRPSSGSSSGLRTDGFREPPSSPNWLPNDVPARSPPRQGWKTNSSRSSGLTGSPNRSGSTSSGCREAEAPGSTRRIQTCNSASRRTETRTRKGCSTRCGTRSATRPAGCSAGT